MEKLCGSRDPVGRWSWDLTGHDGCVRDRYHCSQLCGFFNSTPYPALGAMAVIARRGYAKTAGLTLSKPRLPVTVQMLARVRHLLDMRQHEDRAFWAAASVATFLLLRLSEFTHRPRAPLGQHGCPSCRRRRS